MKKEFETGFESTANGERGELWLHRELAGNGHGLSL